MDLILIIVAVVLLSFTVTMIVIFCEYASVPDTLITAVFAVCGGECGVMGWIKTNKDKQKQRQWELEDKAYKEALDHLTAESVQCEDTYGNMEDSTGYGN